MRYKFQLIISIGILFFWLLSNAEAQSGLYDMQMNNCKKALGQQLDKQDYDKIKQICDEMKKSCKILDDLDSIINNPSKQKEYQKCMDITNQLIGYLGQRAQAAFDEIEKTLAETK